MVATGSTLLRPRTSSLGKGHGSWAGRLLEAPPACQDPHSDSVTRRGRRKNRGGVRPATDAGSRIRRDAVFGGRDPKKELLTSRCHDVRAASPFSWGGFFRARQLFGVVFRGRWMFQGPRIIKNVTF